MIGNSKDLLVLHEGRRASVYKDSLGYWTIGVGHLVDQRKGGKLPEHIIDALLEWDIAEHKRVLDTELPWARQLSEVRYAVLLDMVFNLGPEPFDGDGIKDWPMFLRQVRDGQYRAAAQNMRATLWAKQVGSRAARLSTMMETDQWPSE